MKKTAHAVITAALMLITSRFVIRIVDATVGIDDDIGLLIILILAVNAVIAGLSIGIYRAFRS